MSLESLDGIFCTVLSMYVGWGEIDSLTIASDGHFELAQSFIVEDVPIDTNDL